MGSTSLLRCIARLIRSMLWRNHRCARRSSSARFWSVTSATTPVRRCARPSASRVTLPRVHSHRTSPEGRTMRKPNSKRSGPPSATAGPALRLGGADLGMVDLGVVAVEGKALQAVTALYQARAGGETVDLVQGRRGENLVRVDIDVEVPFLGRIQRQAVALLARAQGVLGELRLGNVGERARHAN